MPTATAPVFLYDMGNRDHPGNIAQLELEETPWHTEFLDWARSNGINVDQARALEVHNLDGVLKAKVTIYDLNEQGTRFYVPGTEECCTHTETVNLSSLPTAPVVDFDEAGERARKTLGIDGTAGDAQDTPHRYRPQWFSCCVVCGLADDAVVHAPASRRH